MTPKIEPRAKVRIGEKRTSQRSGNEYPAALDYFVCEDAEFSRVAGEKPKELVIQFVHESVPDAFSTGLEWWIKDKNKKPLLACYTKDGGADPIALRKGQMVDPEDVERGPVRGQDRLPITCRARECRHFKNKDCKPIGRLLFRLADDAAGSVWQLDTKSFNTIELIEGELIRVAMKRPVSDARFRLWIELRSKGTDKFPVIHLQEIPVQINSMDDAREADLLLAAARRLQEGIPARHVLASYLDASRPNWREDERYINRIKEIGADAALAKVLEKLAA